MPKFSTDKNFKSAIFNIVREAGQDESVEIKLDHPSANIIDATVEEMSFRVEILHISKGMDEPTVSNRLYCKINGIPREFNINKSLDGRTCVLADGYSSNFEVQPGPKRASTILRHGKPNPKSPLITSPMPATVLEVLGDVGSQVRLDAPLIRIEAMKMITTLTAPFDGIIREIAVSEHQTVAAGQILLRVEEQNIAATEGLKLA
ncbi:acetyl-CoA carboxylase biotin carboxyl carrier protein subunit [Paraburkholderia ginsengisoli]|uniref:Biotin/lipoyl-binding protein n=1 Tax=Paraburkholderia ginsengisoli TaxID=311231 RepID=A0A7T4N362_9BURK|nr:acetyl-CoA carboxylase biotin carboxyl carrier protein subunit [Paraburkholderia ginsengisoli]QQC64387.1 biotin/lipoyl-binding protein [Paraburkholderia ginsengisoli]